MGCTVRPEWDKLESAASAVQPRTRGWDALEREGNEGESALRESCLPAVLRHRCMPHRSRVRIIVLDGLEERSENILEAALAQQPAMQAVIGDHSQHFPDSLSVSCSSACSRTDDTRHRRAGDDQTAKRISSAHLKKPRKEVDARC